MQYLCPKCGNFMGSVSTASIPAIITYVCFTCGYSSKPENERPLYMTLPKELQSEEDDDEI